ncbi:MAG: SPFH domain-containing protein [Candidatus Thorarchaeota archaeon]
MQMQIEFIALGLVTLMGIFALCFVASGIKILKEWDRVAVLRMGKFLGIRGPGIVWITPLLDRIAVTVSLKIQEAKVDTRDYVSSDGIKRRLTGHVNWRVVDIQKVVLSVENYKESIRNVVQQHVQKIAESFTGDTVFMDENLYTEIQLELEPILSSWGVEFIEINLKAASEWD